MKNFPKELRPNSGSIVFLDNTRLLLAFKQPQSMEELHGFLMSNGLELEETRKDDSAHNLFPVINHTAKRFWVRSSSGRAIDDELFDKINEALSDSIDWIGPVYQSLKSTDVNNHFCPIPNVVLLRKIRNARIDAIVDEFGLKIDENKSKYLTAFYYLYIEDLNKINAYELKSRLANSGHEVMFENMPMRKPLAATIPNDTLWANQWNMTQINAPNAWDISTGNNSVVICVLDEGCDLTHPDLQFSEDGINLGTMMPTGAPTGSHGTACAGIAAATFNNNAGVAGVAGNCFIMPVAFENWTDVECANGINYATTNGADIISMSFGVYDGWGWNYATIDPEIDNAFNNNVVMAVATGNEDDGTTNRYPGRHPLVIAVGGSSTDDNRKTFTSPDGECWGANFGEDVYDGITTGVSVVAPCVQCPTTDIQGADGYNNNGGPITWACVNYPSSGDAGGDYFAVMNGTSAATPHVAGLAALLRSQYPTLSNVQVRNTIERTAAKVGTLAYAEQTGFPNGTRNQEMGYGRIDAFQALDIADVMIKDWSGDTGAEPSNPPGGNFWDFSDIVVRINDDNVFNPSNPSQSKNVERGQSNFIYVQVTNNGPQEARNVVVDCRITPWIGLEFRYPDDWTLVDAMHVQPASVTANFASVPAGATVMAKFTISSAQTDTLYGWENSNPWHPCLLANVVSDNDYAFASATFNLDPLSRLKNNLAQRNLTVIDVLADAAASLMAFPFIAGHIKNEERFMDIVVENVVPQAGTKIFLNLDNDGKAFPLVDFDRVNQETHKPDDENGLVFLETTKVETTLGCCRGILTIAKGSRFDCLPKKRVKPIKVKGGEIVVRNGKQYVELRGNKAIVQVEKEPGMIYPMSVDFELQKNIAKGSEFEIRVSQRDPRGVTVGGATAIYYFK